MKTSVTSMTSAVRRFCRRRGAPSTVGSEKVYRPGLPVPLFFRGGLVARLDGQGRPFL